MQKLFYKLIIIILFQLPLVVQAQEVMTFFFSESKNTIYAIGDIKKETKEEFRFFLKKHNKLGSSWQTKIELYSNGGNVYAALELGRMIRQHQISTNVEVMCSSACTYTFMGGINRTVGETAKIGVHQFYNRSAMETPDAKLFSANDTSRMQELSGSLIEYISEMGVDVQVIVIANKTKPSEMYYLSKNELAATKIINDAESNEKYKTSTLIVQPQIPSNIPSVSNPDKPSLSSSNILLEVRNAQINLGRTKHLRFEGSCRSAGALISYINNRGTPNAIGVGMLGDKEAAIDDCARMSASISSAANEQEISLDEAQKYKICTSNNKKNKALFVADCHTGTFTYGYEGLENPFIYRVYLPKNLPKPSTYVDAGSMWVRMKNLRTNNFLNDSCADGLQQHANNYMALCDMSEVGVGRYGRFNNN